jgi:superfamily II DNA helicase RecQ
LKEEWQMSLAAALRKLGFTMLREGQDKIIESIMRGDDTLGILPTSGGKSACYQIPGLCKGYKVLIFSPLVALMKDQMESMLRRGLKADQISSGQTPRENISSLNRWAQDLIQFLLVSPERMGSTEFQETMLKFPPDLLVVDECFTPDVEILTSRGFIRFDALMETDLCAQYDSDTKGISFVVPKKFIKKQYDGKVVHITAPKLCDITATPNHEFLVLNKTTKKFKKETFEKIKFNSFKHAKVAGYKTGGSSDILTPQEKFLIAYQADGSLHRQSQNHKQLAFSFTKQRKIDRFLSLCKACNLNVWEVNDRVGRRRFMVQSQVASKLLRDNFRPCDMTLSKCKAFIEEMVHWDGSIISTNTYYYSSTIKDNTDLVQEVALLAGYKTNQTIERDDRSSNYNDVHRLFILKNRDYIGTSQFKKEEQDYNGFVYCVRVPKHNIIVRKNGKPLVVGNCHCVSQWADSFRPNYRMIGSFIETYNPKQVLAITATCTKEIEADIRNYLKLEHATRVLSFPVRENLHLSSRVVNCFDDAVLEAVATIRKDPTQPTIIYCATVKNVTAVYDYLCRIGYGEKAGMYHGQLPPDQRNSVQTMFMHDKISIMVATNAFGMGVDKPNIRRVIHLDIPNSIESLSQECVTPDMYISTLTHLKQAKDIKKDDVMLNVDFKGETVNAAQIVKTYSHTFSGDLTEIRTKFGGTLQVTPNHPIMVYDDISKSFITKEAKFCKEGDTLASLKTTNYGNIQTPYMLDLLKPYKDKIFVKVSKDFIELLRSKFSAEDIRNVFKLHRLYDYSMYKYNKAAPLENVLNAASLLSLSTAELSTFIEYYKTRGSKRVYLPTQLTTDLCWFMGIMATDGNVKYVEQDASSGFGNHVCRLSNTNELITTKFKEIAESLGLHTCSSYRYPPSKNSLQKKKAQIIEVSSPVLVYLCDIFSIPRNDKTYTVRVPSFLYKLDDTYKGSYIAGVVDGDGNIARDKHVLRIHTASWNYISDLAMLFRSLGFPAVCYKEDYISKRDVMIARSNYGYSLRIGSLTNLIKLTTICGAYACKDWSCWSKDLVTTHLNNQRTYKEIVIGNISYVMDTIQEIVNVPYNGSVLNWTVEPGNQLWVNGTLTHNCGRSGRDGLNSYCISYYYDQALSLQEWFIENKYPEEKYIREIYKAFPRYKKGNSIEVTGSTLAKDLGLNSGVVDSCMNLLISNEIIERENAEDKTTTIKLESNKEDVVLKLSSQKQRFYAKLVDALHSMTITTTDTFSVPIMGLSEVMMETMTTLKNNLKALTEAGVIDYQAPFTGKPFKVLQTLDNFDFKLLALRRATSFRKLKELTQYYFIDDAIKQKFMQDYFTAINS